ncbi:MAG: hypothetical protein RXR09_06420, partial [Acidilobus sp.]
PINLGVVAATAAPSAEKGRSELTIPLTPNIKVSGSVSGLLRVCLAGVSLSPRGQARRLTTQASGVLSEGF